MVIKSIAGEGVTTGDVFVGIGWYFLMELIVIALLIIFPDIALILPKLMFAR
jgi:TRAP-type mannitol/chloroaromatic compound transport system permease large subunit